MTVADTNVRVVAGLAQLGVEFAEEFALSLETLGVAVVFGERHEVEAAVDLRQPHGRRVGRGQEVGLLAEAVALPRAAAARRRARRPRRPAAPHRVVA